MYKHNVCMCACTLHPLQLTESREEVLGDVEQRLVLVLEDYLVPEGKGVDQHGGAKLQNVKQILLILNSKTGGRRGNERETKQENVNAKFYNIQHIKILNLLPAANFIIKNSHSDHRYSSGTCPLALQWDT